MAVSCVVPQVRSHRVRPPGLRLYYQASKRARLDHANPAPVSYPEPVKGVLTAIGYADFVPTAGRVPFPDVCCDLTWVRGEVYLTGPESRPTETLFPGERVQLLRLDPFVAREWLGVPLGVVANRQIALQDIDRLLAAQIRVLAEKDSLISLHQAPGGAVTRVARGRLARAMATLRQTRSVRQAAFTVDLSERHLERLFASELGLLPRECVRIVRFRMAGQAARRGATLADAAALAGYADQAHFTRDTRAFTGKTPQVLIREHVGIVQDAEIGHF